MDSSNGRLGGDGGVCVRAPTEQTQHPASSLSLTSIPLDCAGQKKALLIGIRTSRTGGYPELKGAHDDVYKMRKLLLDVYNYTPTEINILMDDGHHVEPTRDNILAAIAKLVKDVKDGDHLLFHYSGHSTQVENPRSKSEEDGKDECLIPLDGEEMKIVDNELHASLVAPLPAGAHLVAVLDTCHSGSLLDLKHYRCNRVPVPWLYRGKRNSEEPRNMVVRQGARLLTLSQTGGPAHQASTPAKRRSIISVMCDPPASSAPSSRSSTYTSTGLTRAGTGSGPAKGPLARLRNASASARARAASLSLSLSIPAPAEDKENLTADAVGPVLPAFSKLTWILPDEEAHCESPVGQFPCNGWCRNMEGHSTCVAPDADDEVKADVVSLASCKDSQLAWEADGVSMTSSLVDLLRENPHRSLKDVLISISHATYSLALMRHGRSQAHKRNRKAYATFLKRHIARLERGNRSTASLVPSPTSDPDTPRNGRLVPRPTFPTHADAMDASGRGKMKGLVKRVGEQIASLKQQLLDMNKNKGYDTSMFQNPELASPRPLDMNRPWRM